MSALRRFSGPVLLVAAVGWLIAFHFLPAFLSPRGWEIWIRASDVLGIPGGRGDVLVGMVLAVLGYFAAGVIASPFMIPVIRRSVLARCLILMPGVLVMIGALHAIPSLRFGRLGSEGVVCLLVAAVCHFLGILLIPYEGRHRERLRKIFGN
ncbi:hypothetical protein OKA04_08025 [Luteolibacter flavescens]|uniref:Uncharacterized protein n=1 Tax=Luteolibacter flavescens TaxID=1859460 RepID=A0ABT3FM83_9BACT|nr:hypothetical protein [Luteolibacter flavescens]MCW1884673.1 hypothetical protein [Luteolibacter flavescens]